MSLKYATGLLLVVWTVSGTLISDAVRDDDKRVAMTTRDEQELQRHSVLSTILIKLGQIEEKMKKQGTQQDLCSKGWFQHGSSCYLFRNKKENWHSALLKCQEEGGYLAEINDETENELIKRYVMYLNDNIWIGGSDAVNEGEWRWVNSGTRISFYGWHIHEPQGGRGENCLLSFLSINGLWVDASCGHAASYVCESDIKSV